MTSNMKPAGKSILLVDDTPENLHLLAGILSKNGYTIRAASNGAAALTTIDKEQPDLILLDIMMPGMDGYEVCRKLKENEKTREIPVIFLSGLTEADDKVKAFQAGGVDYIPKPFQTEEVIIRIQTHLELQSIKSELQEQNRLFKKEIDDRKNAEENLQHHNRKLALLNYMSQSLQTCSNEQESYHIVTDICDIIYPGSSGYLHLLNPDNGTYEAAAIWGTPPIELTAINITDIEFIHPDNTGLIEHLEMGPISLRIRIGFVSKKRYLFLPIGPEEVPKVLLSFHFQDWQQEEDNQERKNFIESEWRILIQLLDHYDLSLNNMRLRETLRYESIRDPLTGLYNRRHMEAVMEREADRAKRKKTLVGIIMCDIDHFKQFNDTHGHEAGDMVLQELGTLLKYHTRKEDIACRYGGEEFLIILPEIEPETLKKRAEDLLQKVRKLSVTYQGEGLPITISAGASILRSDDTMQSAINGADAALYKAKDQGRDCVVGPDED